MPAQDVVAADLMLTFRVGARDLTQVNVIADTNGGSDAPQAALECTTDGCSQLVARGANGMPTVRSKGLEYVEGGLLLEVLEPREIRLLWSAYGHGGIAHDKPMSDQQFDGAVRDLLQSLPGAQ